MIENNNSIEDQQGGTVTFTYKDPNTNKDVVKQVHGVTEIIDIEDNYGIDPEFLISVDIGEGVTSIGEYAFANCKKLLSAKISNSVTSIGEYAFAISSVESVVIGKDVTDIDDRAFYNCSSLKGIVVDPSNPKYTSGEDGNAIVDRETCVLLVGCNSTDISKLGNITSIGKKAFAYSGIISVIIPEGVTSIGEGAFANSSVESVVIGKDVTDITNSAVLNCSSLKRIVVDPSNPKYTSGEDGNAIVDREAGVLVAGCNSTDMSKLGNITSIGNWAFYKSDISAVGIPDSVIDIGHGAFSSSCVESVTIGKRVKNIYAFAFSDCHRLTSLTIPNNVTYIDMAFVDCDNLKQLTLPSIVDSNDDVRELYKNLYKSFKERCIDYHKDLLDRVKELGCYSKESIEIMTQACWDVNGKTEIHFSTAVEEDKASDTNNANIGQSEGKVSAETLVVSGDPEAVVEAPLRQ